MAVRSSSTVHLGQYVGRPRSWNVLKNCFAHLPVPIVAWTSGKHMLCLSMVHVDQSENAPGVQIRIGVPHIEHFSWTTESPQQGADAPSVDDDEGCSADGQPICVGRCGVPGGCVTRTQHAQPRVRNTSTAQLLAIAGHTRLEVWRIVFEKSPRNEEYKFQSSECVYEYDATATVGRICGISWKPGGLSQSLFVSGETSCGNFEFGKSVEMEVVPGPVKDCRTHHCWSQSGEYVAIAAAGELRVQEIDRASAPNTCLCVDLDHDHATNAVQSLSDVRPLVMEAGNSKCSVFFGHGETLLSSLGPANLGTERRGSLNQVYRDMEERTRRKERVSADEASQVVDQQLPLVEGNDSGPIDLTLLNAGKNETTRRMSALDALLNLNHAGTGMGASSSFVAAQVSGNNPRSSTPHEPPLHPSLLFFRFENNGGNRSIRTVGNVSMDRQTDLVAHFGVDGKNIIAIANNVTRSVQLLDVTYAPGDTLQTTKRCEVCIDNDKKHVRLAGMAFRPDKEGDDCVLYVLVASRESQSTFFTAEATTFEYTLHIYSVDGGSGASELVEMPVSAPSATLRVPEPLVTPPTASMSVPSNSPNAVMIALMNMQAHLDARMDRIDGMLLQQATRLSRLESKIDGKRF
jgi:hypothetical protein